MTEKFRPTPDSVRKQNAPEAAAGPLGISPPPPDPEQQPQGGTPKSPEPDLRGQTQEAALAHGGSESTHVQQKLSKADAAKLIGVSLGTLYRFINGGSISVEREGTIDTAEALRFASARAQEIKQRPTLEERAQRQREARREYAREYVKANIEKVRAQQQRYRQERKERRRLQAEEQQPPQFFVRRSRRVHTGGG